MQSPFLRVRGLPSGAVLSATVGETVVMVKEDGSHPLPEGDWLVIECENAQRSTICDVFSKVA